MTRLGGSGWVALLLAIAACEPDIPVGPPAPAGLDAELRALLTGGRAAPIGEMPPEPQALVALGQALMFDKILSGNRDVSCATCHVPSLGGADGLSLSIGTGGSGSGASRTLGAGRRFVPRNSPSLLNQGLRSGSVFWDGRISGPVSGPFTTPAKPGLVTGVTSILGAQAMFPVTNREEMRGDPGDVDVFGNPNELAQIADTLHQEIWQAVMQRLLAIPEYVAMFNAAYPATETPALRFQHAANAIAAFETARFTYADSPFDRYLNRNDAAMTTEQKQGALLFFGRARCVSCHNGALLGGVSLANDGVPQIGPGVGKGAPLDWGRSLSTSDTLPSRRFRFRVPPLRNVELTAPYMHNGAYPTLEAVIRHYDDVPAALGGYDASQIAPELRPLYRGDASTIAAVMLSLDVALRTPLGLTESEKSDLVAFLKALTDPAARDLSSLAPQRVPSGLPVE